MTMTTEEQKLYDEIIRDAKDPSIERDTVLHRASKLGYVINGDERMALTQAVERELVERRPRDGSRLAGADQTTIARDVREANASKNEANASPRRARGRLEARG